MPMEFEAAIENAQVLFLFDRRSQRQLQEMAEEAPPRSRDRYLIQLTMAAFAYYNSADGQGADLRKIIAQAMGVLREIKQFREDRVFFTLALRMEVDLLLHLSALTYQEAEPRDKPACIFNEEDTRALSICETLLKNFPTTFDPLPSAWYSGVIPLFPPFRDEVVLFYRDRVVEHRMVALTQILEKLRQELTLAAGVIRAKQFIAEHDIAVKAVDRVTRYLISNVQSIARFVETALPPSVSLTSDIALPRGITPSQLETAVGNVTRQIDAARSEKDIRKFTGHLLQLGILQFLRENPEGTVSALLRTLKASARISPEDKQIRQFQHEKFPDIPFMVGTSFLRAALEQRPGGELLRGMLDNCAAGLMRAIALQPHYHQAYVNLLVALRHRGEPGEPDELIRLYLQHFKKDLEQINGTAFRNLAVQEHHANQQRLSPEVVQWLLLSEFCTGGELNKAQRMLQELKTLYILNAHDFSIAYLDAYRSSFRMKDEEFIKSLENDELHSALLFYIAHAFTSLALMQGRGGSDLVIEYANLDQAIDLNGEALYFNPRNGSALRLVDTQAQILQYALARSQKRWENINQTMGQRFQFYEEYLRQEKSTNALRERLTNLKLDDRLPELKISRPALARMSDVISEDQRDRLKHRVEAT
ncbi:MAG TPA: hypothetical protein VKB51_15175 [bacterium]|nr:hypothetical protein [bacterium]